MREEERRPTSYTWEGGRKEGRKEGRREGERGLENQSRVYSRSQYYCIYLQFDSLWPLYNSDVEDFTKLNGEISIKSAWCVCGGGVNRQVIMKLKPCDVQYL